MIVGAWDDSLWWVMFSAGSIAATLSVITSILDRRRAQWPKRNHRLLMHLLSYGFLTISILAFVLRGLAGPS